MAVTNPADKYFLRTVSEDRYETLVQLSPDALYVVQDGRLVFANTAGIRLLGASGLHGLVGVPISKLLHPDSIEQANLRMAEMLRTGQPAPPSEQQYLRMDGSVVDVEVHSCPFIFEGRPAIRVISRDITDRKAAEKALRMSHDRQRTLAQEATRAKEVLQQEKAILELIALDRPLPEVLREICLGAEKVLSGNARCSVLLLYPQAKCVRIGAAPSLPEAYSQSLDGTPIGAMAGSCGTAIYFNKLVVVEDIEHDPLWDMHRAAAIAEGIRACWSVPIVGASETMLGAFDIYYFEPRKPSAEDLAFISDITHLVGIAIHKDRVERSLEESEERYRSVVTTLTEGILMQSRDGRILTCNPSAQRILRIASDHLNSISSGGTSNASSMKRARKFRAESCLPKSSSGPAGRFSI
jgi:PAS domain S-box-containing protein